MYPCCSVAPKCLGTRHHPLIDAHSCVFRAHQIFDPLGLSDGAAPGDIKKWREAEIKHGRVAMLASLGVLVAEVSESRDSPRLFACVLAEA